MSVIKFSKQRECIKEYLLQTKSHPNAEDVYMHIRESFPSISLGTVYRNLNFLVARGEILRLAYDDESIHYDGNINPHYHFVCRNCRKVIDLHMVDLSHINILAEAHFKGKIEGHSIFFSGLCSKCNEN